mmetsp:Transcript_5892/g.14496  ORF Transcript_5892/g.14496 Transcript_5892/m.14496 type:complete len:168 (+) Transcript_5892:4166-4669(+)
MDSKVVINQGKNQRKGYGPKLTCQSDAICLFVAVSWTTSLWYDIRMMKLYDCWKVYCPARGGGQQQQQQLRRNEVEGGAATTIAALSCSQSRANSFQPPEEDKGTIGPVVFLSVSRWLSVVFPNRTNHQSLSISLYPSLKWSIGMIPNGTVQLVQLTSTLWCNRRSL